MDCERNRINADVVIGSLLAAIFVYFYRVTGSFHNPDSAVWPKGVLLFCLSLSVVLILRGLRLGNLQSGEMAHHYGPAMIALLVMTLYAIVMSFTGYFISTTIFVPAGMIILGQRKLTWIFAITFGLEAFVYLLFVSQLQLSMPG